MLRFPRSRGPVTAGLLAALSQAPGSVPLPDVPRCCTPLADEDHQLALTLCYELHYRGLPGVDERWEWDPALLELRAALEAPFEGALRAAVAATPPDGVAMDDALRRIAADDESPSLSRHLMRDGTAEQFREFLVHRSIYQLKEADPHSWAIPRLSGRPKAAMVEIQSDEYGGGDPDRIHAVLFAKTLRAMDLDDRYGAYVDLVPAITLATVNLMSLFGLHRRLRGAIVGHLALFEMTSSIPNRRYGDGLRRLGLGDPDVVDFFDEHVEADAVHESVAAVDLAGGLAAAEPELAGDILFGARALAHVEGLWAAHVLAAWHDGRSSLRMALPTRAEEALAA